MHSLDQQHRIADVNDEWLELLGYQRDEVIGRSITDFYLPGSLPSYETPWRGLLDAGSLRDADRTYVKKSGEVIEVLLSAVVEARRRGKPAARHLGGHRRDGAAAGRAGGAARAAVFRAAGRKPVPRGSSASTANSVSRYGTPISKRSRASAARRRWDAPSSSCFRRRSATAIEEGWRERVGRPALGGTQLAVQLSAQRPVGIYRSGVRTAPRQRPIDHRRDQFRARHQRAPAHRGGAQAIAEDGVARPAHRRRCARFQQSAHRRHRQPRNPRATGRGPGCRPRPADRCPRCAGATRGAHADAVGCSPSRGASRCGPSRST